jgi:hypothetical protein
VRGVVKEKEVLKRRKVARRVKREKKEELLG